MRLSRQSKNGAVWLVVVSVMLFAPVPSLPPLVPSVGVLWLTAYMQIGHCAATVLLCLWRHRVAIEALMSRPWQQWMPHMRSREFVLSLLARNAALCVLPAAVLIGPTLVAVVWGLLPMVYALLLSYSARDSGERMYEPAGARIWTAFGVGFTGCVLAVLAQPVEVLHNGWLLAAGLCLAATGALIDGCIAFNVVWGMAAGADSPSECRHDAQLVCSVAVSVPGSVITVAVVVALSRFVSLGGIGAPGQIAASVGFGFFLAVAPYMWRLASFRTATVGVFVAASWQTAASVGFAVLMGQAEQVSDLYLAISALTVTIAALLANGPAERFPASPRSLRFEPTKRP